MDQTMNQNLKNINVFFFTAMFSCVLFFVFSFCYYYSCKIMGPPPVAVPQNKRLYANDDTVIGQSNEIQNVTMSLLMKFHLM